MHNLVRRDLPSLVGRKVPEAEVEDVVQAFLTDAVEKQWLLRADQRLGRFRGFLKTLMKRYLYNYATHLRRHKRDPSNARILSLSQELPNGELVIDPAAENHDDDEDFDRDWARAVVTAAVDRMQRRNPTQANVIHNELQGQPLPDDALAIQLNVKPASIRVLRMRARKSFRAAVKAEVTATIADPEDINDELEHNKKLLAEAN
jgi:hypothetical protein